VFRVVVGPEHRPHGEHLPGSKAHWPDSRYRSLYRRCPRSNCGRKRLPRAGFPNLKVVVDEGAWRLLPQTMAAGLRRENGQKTASRRAIGKVPPCHHAAPRPAARLSACGVVPTADDAFDFSMWRGYDTEPDTHGIMEWFRTVGARSPYIHTSGMPRRRSTCLRAGRPTENVVPVHGMKMG